MGLGHRAELGAQRIVRGSEGAQLGLEGGELGLEGGYLGLDGFGRYWDGRQVGVVGHRVGDVRGGEGVGG